MLIDSRAVRAILLPDAWHRIDVGSLQAVPKHPSVLQVDAAVEGQERPLLSLGQLYLQWTEQTQNFFCPLSSVLAFSYAGLEASPPDNVGNVRTGIADPPRRVRPSAMRARTRG
jgi:hypothetical protein